MVKTKNRLVATGAYVMFDVMLTFMFLAVVASGILLFLGTEANILGISLLLAIVLFLWFVYVLPNPAMKAFMPTAREEVYKVLTEGSGVSSVGLRFYDKRIDALIINTLCNGRFDLFPSIEDWQLDFVRNNACQLIYSWSDNTVGPDMFSSLKKFVGEDKDLQRWVSTRVFDDFGYTAATYALSQAVINKSVSRARAVEILNTNCVQSIYQAAKFGSDAE